MNTTLVLADPHPVVLEGMKHGLAGEADFRILACAQNDEEALRVVRQFEPDILVLELALPKKGGLALIREMKRAGLVTAPVLFTAIDGEDNLEAMRLGARGVVPKNMSIDLLARCIREVDAGRKWLEKGVAAHALETLLKREEGSRELHAMLTPREIAVARMVCEGMPNKTVAERLAITEGTVKLHLHSVYKKLELHGRLGLMHYMQRAGLS
jgi:DNA-binding NarL/FixJ family response regulator